jgi:uncharacterized membrane protein YkgB
MNQAKPQSLTAPNSEPCRSNRRYDTAQLIAGITIYIVAILLMTAHFLRTGSVIGAALYLATPLLFLVRQRWSLLLLQVLVYAAAIIWLGTTWQLVSMRQSLGQPWFLAATILVTVAAISVLAGELLSCDTVKERYRDR